MENRIYWDDCLDVMEHWLDTKPTLIFADPPYNAGVKYDFYKDIMKSHIYIRWCREWIQECYNILSDNGSLWIAINNQYVCSVLSQVETIGFNLKNWVIWQYNFGQAQKNKFTPCHTHLLHLVKDKNNFIFNANLIKFPSQRLIKYKDKRAKSDGALPGDIWNYSRICGTFKEKRSTPNQMPGALLRRVIFACSNAGDLVFDPFVGSGTTCIEAKRLKRNYIGIDISEKYVENCKKYLNDINDEKELSNIILNDLLYECNITLNEFEKMDKNNRLYKCIMINFHRRISGTVYNTSYEEHV